MQLRMDTIENNIVDLKFHDQEFLKTQENIMQSLNIINTNLSHIIDASSKLGERIKILENDLQERDIKKRFYKSLIAFYPILMMILLWTLGISHNKVENLVTNLNAVMKAVVIKSND